MTLQPDYLKPALTPWLDAPRWWLGLSGGLDSSTLLALLLALRDADDLPPLAAVHVNHQLHPHAGRWADHCAALCRASGLPLVVREVEVEDTGAGPEAAARAARYGVFETLLEPGEVLLLAHHLDDQVETFFLRLMRGAGTRGLAGMPASRPLGEGHLVRPLIQVSRAELEAYAGAHELRWVEDSSNRDTALDRNFLRQRLLPVLEQRWPGYRSSVARSMDALASAEDQLAGQDLARLAESRGESLGEAFLDLATLAPGSAAELSRYLRRWLESLGQVAPTQSRLLEFARQLLEGQEHSQPALEAGGYALRRYRDRVHLVPEVAGELVTGQWIAPGSPVAVPGLGSFAMEPATKAGLRLPADGGWELRFRSGGERCRPLGRERSQSLKKLLQEYQVPPWLRERLPLLYAGDELAAVADLFVCTGQESGPGQEGWRLHWDRLPEAPLD